MTLVAVDTFPARNRAVRAAAAAGHISPNMMAGLEAQARAAGLVDIRASGARGTPPGDSDDALARAFTDFKTHHNSELSRVVAQVDKIEEYIDADNLARTVAHLDGEPGARRGRPVDAEYSGQFGNYVRRGASDAEASLKAANATGDRAAIQAAMSEGDNSSGGYLAPVEWDRQIQKAQRHLSPMRRLSQVVTTARSAYSTLWSDDLFGSGWVGETAARPTTNANSFAPIVVPAGEIYAMPAVTQRLLDDSAIDLEDWLAKNLSDEFSRQEGVAFVGGNGVNKPMGFLQYVPGGAAAAAVLDGNGNVVTPAQPGAHPGGNLGITVSGSAAAVDKPDALIDLKYGLLAPYRQNGTWVMNSSTAAVIAKLKDGQGNYLWREALLANEPATLLGRPVEIDENMPNIAAGNYPIAFGDFQRGYLVNDRVGVRILRDPYTNKPFVMFYATKRVGGAVLDPRAIRVLKVAAA